MLLDHQIAGNPLEPSPTKPHMKMCGGQGNDLGYGNNGEGLGYLQLSPQVKTCGKSSTAKRWSVGPPLS